MTKDRFRQLMKRLHPDTQQGEIRGNHSRLLAVLRQWGIQKQREFNNCWCGTIIAPKSKRCNIHAIRGRRSIALLSALALCLLPLAAMAIAPYPPGYGPQPSRSQYPIGWTHGPVPLQAIILPTVIKLEWNLATEALDGYTLLWGTESTAKTNTVNIVGLATTHSFTAADPTVKHYFALQAYHLGINSDLSNEVVWSPSVVEPPPDVVTNVFELVTLHAQDMIGPWEAAFTNTVQSTNNRGFWRLLIR